MPRRIASHNVYEGLSDSDAGRSVRAVLQKHPDIIGLQEWGRDRRSVLKKFGTVVTFPRLRHLWSRYPDAGYVFVYPLGGQPVGVDAAVFEVVIVRRVLLSSRRKGVRAAYGTEVVLRPRAGGRPVAVLNLHLLAHHDIPANHAAWLEGVKSVAEWVESCAGHDCYVMGDFNHEAVKLDGLRSCCDVKPVATFRGRAIDHIYGRRPLSLVAVINTPSDHDALVVEEG